MLEPTKTDGTSCNDSNACTQRIPARASAWRQPVVCTASDQCHDVDLQPGTGMLEPDQSRRDDVQRQQRVRRRIPARRASHWRQSGRVYRVRCHDVGTRSPGTGTCSNPNKTDGTSCNDSNACTQTDCAAGVCTGEPCGAMASDQCHDVGTCSPGVLKPDQVDGTTCNDSMRARRIPARRALHWRQSGRMRRPPTSGTTPAPAVPNGHLLESEQDRRRHVQRQRRLHATDTCQTGVCTGVARPRPINVTPARATRRRARVPTRTPPTGPPAATATRAR